MRGAGLALLGVVLAGVRRDLSAFRDQVRVDRLEMPWLWRGIDEWSEASSLRWSRMGRPGAAMDCAEEALFGTGPDRVSLVVRRGFASVEDPDLRDSSIDWLRDNLEHPGLGFLGVDEWSLPERCDAWLGLVALHARGRESEAARQALDDLRRFRHRFGLEQPTDEFLRVVEAQVDLVAGGGVSDPRALGVARQLWQAQLAQVEPVGAPFWPASPYAIVGFADAFCGLALLELGLEPERAGDRVFAQWLAGWWAWERGVSELPRLAPLQEDLGRCGAVLVGSVTGRFGTVWMSVDEGGVRLGTVPDVSAWSTARRVIAFGDLAGVGERAGCEVVRVNSLDAMSALLEAWR